MYFFNKHQKETIEEYFNRIISELSESEIIEIYQKEKSISWIKIIIRTVQTFINSFILQKKFMEGISGFIIARLEAISTLIIYCKLWEYQLKNKSK